MTVREIGEIRSIKMSSDLSGNGLCWIAPNSGGVDIPFKMTPEFSSKVVLFPGQKVTFVPLQERGKTLATDVCRFGHN